MSKGYEIILGRGFGNIKLGMTCKEVECIMGSPDEIEEYDYSDAENSVTYLYYGLGVDLTFESEEEYRLSYISFEKPSFRLSNKIKTGISKDKTMKLCRSLFNTEPEIEDMSDEISKNHKLLSYENENVNFWFTDDTLDEIEIGPFWKDDDTPIWPE